MVKLMLEMIFFVSNDFVTALQFSLEDLGRTGLDAVAGENVAVVVHCVLVVSM